MKRLKELRVQYNLSQKELAEKLGVSNCSYCTWERGKFEPCIEALKNLSSFFGVSLDYLIENNSDGKSLFEITEDEQNLLFLYRTLRENLKNDILIYTKHIKDLSLRGCI